MLQYSSRPIKWFGTPKFFDDALQVERTDGSVALERGDVVVMDNCGFHHVRHIEPLAVFILEDALSVQTDNASMAVFILRTHYPTGRTWAKICSSSGYASQV